MTAPKVTIDQINEKIVDEQYIVLPNGRTTVCQITLENGFTVEGTSACVSAENFDMKLGRKIARENAIGKIWPLEGYLLAERIHRGEVSQAAPLPRIESPHFAGFTDGEQ